MLFKYRIFFFSTLVLVASLFLLSFFFIKAEKKVLNIQHNNNNKSILLSIASISEESILKFKIDDIYHYLQTFKKLNPNILYLYVLNSDGIIISHIDKKYIGLKVNFNNDQYYRSEYLPDRFFSTTKNLKGSNILFSNYSTNLRIKEMSFFYNKKGNHSLTVVAGFIIDKLNRSFLDTSFQIIKISFLISIIGIIFLWLIIYNLDNYISIFFKAMTLLGDGKFDTRIKVDGNNELGLLALEFNRMAKKLKELDYLKEDFVSNVTHELRSPLGAIESYLNYMIDEDEEYGLDTDDKAKYKNIRLHDRYNFLLRMRSNTKRLREFINNVLDISKIERGSINLDKKMVNIKILIDDLKNLFFMQAKDRMITIETNVDEYIDLIYIDEERIKQLLTNLLNNAIKFSNINGKIYLSVIPLFNGQIKTRNTIHSIKIVVSDTGIGIPEEHIDKIFNKFEQVKNSNPSTSDKGTGLGLAVAKGIVDAHNGKIWVESVFGQGTSFYVELPAIVLD